MENLKELIHTVNQNKIKRIELLDLKEKKGSKLQQLYQYISKGVVSNDQEAKELLYPDNGSVRAFNKLKQRLKERLLNTLFFIDAYKEGYTDRQTVYYELQKDFAAAQLLQAKNAWNVATDLLQEIFRKAVRFEITELGMLSARQLRLYYGTQHVNEKHFIYYNEQYKHYDHILREEYRVESIYTELVLAFKLKKKPVDILQQECSDHLARLHANSENIDSYKYNFFLALINLYYHTVVNDFPATISICDKWIAYFSQKTYQASTPIQICWHHKIVAYLQLGEYTQGTHAAKESQNYLQEGTVNWFKNQEYQLLIAMHAGQYQAAYHIFCRAVEHRRFSYLSESLREVWRLYQVYIHLMINEGEITVNDKDHHFTSFRINRFLNSVPHFSKDKCGMNVAILIAQILFYIQKRKYGLVIDRIEGIKKYCSRHLQKENSIRSYYFIKLLLCIPKGRFHRVAASRYAQPIMEKLKKQNNSAANQFHKIEIIPYERLWNIALNMLGHKTAQLESVDDYNIASPS